MFSKKAALHGIVLFFSIYITILNVNANEFQKEQKGIEPDLLEVLEKSTDDDTIPVFILLSRQLIFDEQRINALTKGKSKGKIRTIITKELKDIASSQQQKLLATTGKNIEVIKDLWIINSLLAKGRKKDLLNIGRSPEVLRIYLRTEKPDQIIYKEGSKARMYIPPAKPVDPPDRYVIPANAEIPWNIKKVRADQVWNFLGYSGKGVIVAILDSGMNYRHTDIYNRLWINENEVPGNGIDDDKNGYIDDYFGYNFANENCKISDDFFHGSICGAIIVGDGSGGIVTGVAPGARLMVLRMYDQTTGLGSRKMWQAYQYDTWEAFQYMIEMGAHVANMSFDWQPSEKPLKTPWRIALEHVVASGVTMVAGAGNSRGYLEQPLHITPPANSPSVITVAGTNQADELEKYSSKGPVGWEAEKPFYDFKYPPGLFKPDVAAPTGRFPYIMWSGNGYTVKSGNSGTSSSGPHVSGVAALLLEQNPDLMPSEIKKILTETAVDLGELGPDINFGYGRIDAYTALTYKSKPKISISSYFIKNSKNSNIKEVIPGKEEEIEILLKNSGLPVAEFRLNLLTKNHKVGLKNNQDQLINFVENSSLSVKFKIKTDPALQNGSDLGLVLEVGCKNGDKQFFPLEIRTSGSNLLLVDDDGGGVIDQLYKDCLDDMNIKYNVHSIYSDDLPKSLDKYQKVIWLTGDENLNTLDKNEQKIIVDFLNKKGYLILLGQNIGYELHDTDFFKKYIKLEYIQDRYNLNKIKTGVDNKYFKNIQLSFNPMYMSCDLFKPLEPNHDLMAASPPDSLFCGIFVNNKTKLLFLSCGLEGIDDQRDREKFVKEILSLERINN